MRVIFVEKIEIMELELGKNDRKRSIHKYSNRTWVLENKHHSAVVSFSRGKYEGQFGTGKLESVAINGSNRVEVMGWGAMNNLPMARQSLVIENNIVPQIMRTTRNLLIGSGLMLVDAEHLMGTRVLNDLPIPTAAEDFFEFNDFEDVVLPQLARDLIFNATFMPEFVRFNKQERIRSVEAKECAHIRSAKKDSRGKAKSWYWNGAWGKPNLMKDFTTTEIPIWDKSPNQPRFGMLMGDRMFHDDYYNIPVWEGSRDWIELSNLIPVFHIANLNNGFTPRWHIQFPDDYFVDARKYPNIDALNDEEYEAFLKETEGLRLKFLERINDVLAGAENAGNVLWTEYSMNEALNIEVPGIKITALKAELNHDAFMKLFDATNTANISSHGLPPVIASIQTAGRLSAGAEIRNSLLLHLIVNTPYYRKMLLKVVNFIHKTNGWGKGTWAFRDVEITKLDDNKSGQSDGSVQ